MALVNSGKSTIQSFFVILLKLLNADSRIIADNVRESNPFS